MGRWVDHLKQMKDYLATLASTVSGGKLLCDTEITATIDPGVLATHALQTTGNASLGPVTDAVASITVDEDGTARSLVSIAKAQKNMQIDANANLATIVSILNAGPFMRTTGTSTGTGGEQTIAHGLGGIPQAVNIVPTGSNAVVAAYRANATNIYPTVPNGEPYTWSAFGVPV